MILIKIEKWCRRPQSLADLTVLEWRNISGEGEDGCSVLDVDWENYNVGDNLQTDQRRDCTEWEFDNTEFTSTIASEFELLCGRDYLTSLAQTLYFVGMVLGVITFGVLADMYGRKKVLVPLLTGMAVSGIVTSQMPNYVTFIIGRIFNAFLVIAIFETFFTYMLEFVGGAWSTVIGLGSMFVWVLGWLSLAGLAYFLRDWRDLMLYSSLPSLLSVLMYWLLPESPRWLLSVGKIKEAEEIVRSGAKYNNITLPQDFRLRPVQKPDSDLKKRTLIDLFRYKNMRTKTLILYYNWFVNSFAYYGLSLNMGQLTGGSNVYMNFTISGLLEIPAYAGAIVILLYCGRRVPYFVSILLCGVSLLSIVCIPTGVSDWLAVALTLFGKMCVTFSWGVLFLYNAELFPTEVRTSGIGSCSFVGRFGGMVAPWVEMLGQRYNPNIPSIIFGSTALLAGLLAILLPETQGIQLPYTLEEAETLEMGTLWRNKQSKECSPSQVSK